MKSNAFNVFGVIAGVSGFALLGLGTTTRWPDNLPLLLISLLVFVVSGGLFVVEAVLRRKEETAYRDPVSVPLNTPNLPKKNKTLLIRMRNGQRLKGWYDHVRDAWMAYRDDEDPLTAYRLWPEEIETWRYFQ